MPVPATRSIDQIGDRLVVLNGQRFPATNIQIGDGDFELWTEDNETYGIYLEIPFENGFWYVIYQDLTNPDLFYTEELYKTDLLVPLHTWHREWGVTVELMLGHRRAPRVAVWFHHRIPAHMCPDWEPQ